MPPIARYPSRQESSAIYSGSVEPNLLFVSLALLIRVAEENRRWARRNYNNLIRDSLYSLFWVCNAIKLYASATFMFNA